MKKKLLTGFIICAVLFCTPFFQLNLSSDIITQTLPSDSVAGSTSQQPLPEPNPNAPLVIDSSVGILTYFNQCDPKWGSAIYGGNDPISDYGCGPTALAMLVTSFTENNMNPAEMAAWAYSNHYWASGAGSKHNLIPEGAAAFGLRVEPLSRPNSETAMSYLKNGYILVALMGPGHFTKQGHFIIISNYWSQNQVSIADPANLENTLIPWDIDLILSELSSSAQSGGPIWAVRP